LTIKTPSFAPDVDISGLQLTIQELRVVAAIPAASFGLPAVTAACALPGATCYANLDAAASGFVDPGNDSDDLKVLYSLDPPSESQAYLAFNATPFSGTFPSG